jgi:SAM-dependent methyltransferase
MAWRTAIGKAAIRLARWCNATRQSLQTAEISYGAVGMRDAVRSGWYRDETRELFAGFPISPSDIVADIGCGGGGNSLFCAKFAAHLIAVDVDPKAVASLERRLRANSAATYRVAVSDGNPLPIESATVDKVICTEVLEHVDDVKQFFGELARIGKRGAQYLLSVPDALSEKILMRVSPPSSYAKPNHIRVIERDEFAKLADDAGLVVQKRAYYGFYWSVWNALVWQTGVDFDRGNHPALDHWALAWSAVLDLPQGDVCKAALDDNLPKSQVIIAYKK